VAQVSDRLAVLVQGRLAHLGSLASLLRDPESGNNQTIEAALGSIYGS
jgi:hypothetical protein